jgi:hypothetical protein
MIEFGIIFSWSLCQVDFGLAYPQAPIETNIYMELPQGIQVANGNSKDHVLKLLKNIYGQKLSGRVWNSFLVDKLTSIGFQPPTINDCVFFCGDIILWYMLMMEFSLGTMTLNSRRPSEKSKLWV